jgi:CDP-4-dehydro-6-deoxyglucose reductase
VVDVEIKLLPARVASLKKLSHDVMEMKLSLPANERLAFRAGQYIEFILRDKSRRAFSLANAPSNDEFLELHLRLVEGGKFTQHVFTEMKEKALVRIEGPFGSFAIKEVSNLPILLVAGGTGFAPLKAMVEQLIAENDLRPVTLYWRVRTEEDMYHHELALSWVKQHPSLTYTPVLSDTKNNQSWQGKTGFVHQAVIDDNEELSGFDVYVAGPPAMVNATKKAFLEKGLPEDQLLFDAFEFTSLKDSD